MKKNILLHFTTLNYKVWHQAAIQLSKLYPGSKFAGIVHAHGDIVGFLKQQHDIDYQNLLDLTNVETSFLDNDYNNEVLKRYEETTAEKSLWRFIAVDRQWGWQFCKGALPVKLLHKKELTSDNALKVVYGYIALFNKLFDEFKPDVVLFKIGMHSIFPLVMEQICKNRNIVHVSPVETKVQNYFALTPNKESTFPHINRTYEQLYIGKLEIDLSPGIKCYNAMMDAVRSKNGSYYFDQGDQHIKKLSAKRPNGYAYSMFKSLVLTTLSWIKMRKLEKQKRNEQKVNGQYTYQDLLYGYYYNVYKVYQTIKAFKESFYEQCDFREKYLYYPLHLVPEYTIQVQANIWINQLFIIEILAKSIPFDWKIYVKEHPGQIQHRVRPSAFYKEIKSYANVKLVPFYEDNQKIIANSQFVVTVTGTVGWEAILFHNKPVINLAESLYEITGLSKRCESIADLSKEIQHECHRIGKISPQERKKRLIYLINAVIMHSAWADSPLTVLGEDTQTPSDAMVVRAGKQVADLTKRYIEI